MASDRKPIQGGLKSEKGNLLAFVTEKSKVILKYG